MKIHCHLFVQIADYLALAFHMLSTIPTGNCQLRHDLGQEEK